MLWKCCTQYASKFGKLSSGHRTEKGQFSFQPLRKAMAKNARTTAQLHSSHLAAAAAAHACKAMLKILQARLQQYMNCELPDVQARFRKGRGTRDKLPTSVGSSKKQEGSRSLFLLYWIPWLQSMGSQGFGHDWVTNSFTFTNIVLGIYESEKERPEYWSG